MTHPQLVISAAHEQSGGVFKVDFRVSAPAHKDIFFYDGDHELVADWEIAQMGCQAPEEACPFLRVFAAQLATVDDLAINAFQLPPIRKLSASAHYEGGFEVPTSLVHVDEDAAGVPIEVVTPLPECLRVQMTVGFSHQPLSIQPTELNLVDKVVDWQDALESNVLQVRRTSCWTVEKDFSSD